MPTMPKTKKMKPQSASTLASLGTVEMMEEMSTAMPGTSRRERSGRNAFEPDYMADLQRDLIAVISKYIKINPNDIKVQLERQDNLEVLEVKIELPDGR